MKTSADLTRKTGIEERDSEIEGKSRRGDRVNGAARAAREIDGKTDRSNGREHMSQSGSRSSFNAGSPVPYCLLLFSIRNLCASHGLLDSRMIANDEMQMSNDEGMTKIRMPNLPKSVQSAEDHLRDLCVLCGEK